MLLLTTDLLQLVDHLLIECPTCVRDEAQPTDTVWLLPEFESFTTLFFVPECFYAHDLIQLLIFIPELREIVLLGGDHNLVSVDGQASVKPALYRLHALSSKLVYHLIFVSALDSLESVNFHAYHFFLMIDFFFKVVADVIFI